MKKYMLSLVALVVAVAAMAFTNVKTTEEVAEETALAVQYQFNGTSMSQLYNTNHWSAVSGSGPACEDGELPCVITVESGTLQQWLNQRDAATILEDADSRKP